MYIFTDSSKGVSPFSILILKDINYRVDVS